MRDTFSSYHPIINFLYFTSVLGVSMFITHPVFLVISLITSIIYSVYLKGKKAWRFNLFMVIPALLLMAMINPMFNHRGETILLYVNDNPLTLESIIYGVITASMLVTMILWFSCYNSVMTSDKFIYLFGKVIPALSLVLSMALRFVPRFKIQLHIISSTQKCIGKGIDSGTFFRRIKNSLRIISILTTWALENSIDTADSMKARGYGLPKRTSFSLYRFDRRDKYTFCIMSVFLVIILLGMGTRTVYSMFIPRIWMNETNLLSLVIYGSYFLLCMVPVFINIWEDIKWNYFRSKI